MAEIPYLPLDAVQVSGSTIGAPPSNAGTELVGDVVEGEPPLHWSDGEDGTYARVVTAGGPSDTLFPDHAYATWPDLTAVDPSTLYDLQFRLRAEVVNLGSGDHPTISILTMASNPEEGGAWQLTAIPSVEVEFLVEITSITFSWREYLLNFSTEEDLPGLWPTVLGFYPEQVRSLSITAEEVGDETDTFQATIYEASLVVVTTAESVIEAVFDLSRCAFT